MLKMMVFVPLAIIGFLLAVLFGLFGALVLLGLALAVIPVILTVVIPGALSLVIAAGLLALSFQVFD